MNQLHQRLLERYVEGYRMVNPGQAAAPLPEKERTDLDLMFGKILDDLPAGSEVLDLGCGQGFLLHWMAQREGLQLAGVDICPGQVEIARELVPSVELCVANGVNYLRRNPGRFAVIFSFDVFEHIPAEDLLDWVQAAHDALIPGGALVLRTPNAANITSSYSRYMDLTHLRCFTVESLTQLLNVGGFPSCHVVPIRSRFPGRTLRIFAESLLHRAVFRICARKRRTEYGYNVQVVGRRE